MNGHRRSLPWAVFVSALAGLTLLALPAGATEIHYAPGENLERLDVATLGSARRPIDIAAYVLTDHPVIESLFGAASRGVAVRIYLDGEQSGQSYMAPVGPLGWLYATHEITIRVKR